MEYNRVVGGDVDVEVQKKLVELERVCARHRARRLALYGSAVTGAFDPDQSALDFAVDFEPMSPKDHADVFFGLLEDLERLFARRVDLIEYGPIRSPYFERELQETQVVLYEAA